MDDTTHLDYLAELTAMPHWRALKKEVRILEEGFVAALCRPIKSLEDLVLKEGYSSKIAALRQLISHVDEVGRQHANQE